MIVLDVELQLVSPLFLGGADPTQSRLRGPAFKSALRGWYRAFDPEALKNESRWFGGAGEEEGQAAFRLMVESPRPLREETFSEDHTRPWREGLTNGVQYLGYSLILRGNAGRRFFSPDQPILLRLVVFESERLGPAGWRALLGAAWCLGNLGAIGARARRGFGSVQALGWSVRGEVPDGWAEDLLKLKHVSAVDRPADALAAIRAAREQLRAWFPGTFPEGPRVHEHLGAKSRLALIPGVPRAPRDNLRWGVAFQAGGLALQRFRAGYEPDRRRARDHVLWMNGRPDGRALSGLAPDRVAFGLPLTFRFIKPEGLRPSSVELNASGSTGGTGSGRNRVAPQPRQRHASPLRMRVLRIGKQDFMLFLRMDGALPGSTGVTVRGGQGAVGRDLGPPTGEVLDRFLDGLSGAHHLKAGAL